VREVALVQRGVGRVGGVTHIQGLYWPDSVGDDYIHAMAHVGGIEWAIEHCPKKRMAVQAGGNIGLWPRRLAAVFDRVITFEPDPVSRECLERNVPENVTVHSEALGDVAGMCGIKHRGLGSHRVVDGQDVRVTTVDSLNLEILDYLQLDVEGYEWHALKGALYTIARCRPVIQVELRNFTEKYGQTDAAVRQMLTMFGYREVSRQSGSDYVFAVAA
jgi:FkbM family methyltransferase